MTDTDARLIQILTDGEMPVVWSLLVTIFGDLTLRDGMGFNGATLNQMTGAIGIKPEAQRVALHRLRKDGWIESERQGRQSIYRLSVLGRAQSEAARPLIYGPAPQMSSCFLVLPPPGQDAPEAATQVAAGTFLTTAAPGSAETLCLPLDTPPPDWMRDRAVDPDLCDASADCERRLAALSQALGPAQIEVALHRAVLRVLIVHMWRRIALKAPRLPDAVLSDGWRGAECRALFAELLARLPRPDPAELDPARRTGHAA